MVERSFAAESQRVERERRHGPEEWKVLVTVARVLHGWNPPSWFDWSREEGLPGPPGQGS
jgi:hypothetical protein